VVICHSLKPKGIGRPFALRDESRLVRSVMIKYGVSAVFLTSFERDTITRGAKNHFTPLDNF
jgi:hypothetical protein